MTASVLHTSFCDLVGVRYPVVQTGMGWVATAPLTAATSEAGGLGILASTTTTFPQLEAAIDEIKSRTDKPFGVNMRADQANVDQVADLLIKRGVRVASFATAPSEKLIKRLKDAGLFTMPTIAAPRHAEKVTAWGVDAVIAQGHEGGGHTGAIPTSLLLPKVTAMVDIPVMGAGGFHDGRGLVAALAYGAAGIAMGTRFLLTKDSGVPDQVKAKYLAAALADTVVTKAIDGQPQRVIRTPLIDHLERRVGPLAFLEAGRNALALRKLTDTSLPALVKEGLAMRKAGGLSLAQMAMAANAPMLTRASLVEGKVESGILPTGQVAGLVEELPTVAELIEGIMAEADATLARLAGTPAPAGA